jgi:hypothetical protein
MLITLWITRREDLKMLRLPPCAAKRIRGCELCIFCETILGAFEAAMSPLRFTSRAKLAMTSSWSLTATRCD